MLTIGLILSLCGAVNGAACLFPPELVEFKAYDHNPIFQGAGPGHWDETIRERGWVMLEEGVYHLWYTGYQYPETNQKLLGYATSTDGIHWQRYPGNPIYSDDWVEDMMIVKDGGTYYMFAEGVGDHAHLFTSTDRIHWTRQGTLDVRKKNGEPLSPGPFGTPTVFVENGTWYLFYERDDEAIWLATSTDLKVWTNVQDEPVLKRGPEPYDQQMLALDQIVKFRGTYYAYYHGLIPGSDPQEWTTAIAASPDLVHWEKYAGNPLIRGDKSSPVLIDDGKAFRLYTMHPTVCLYFQEKPSTCNK